MDHTTACQESDIPIKIIKENSGVSEFLHPSFNASVNEETFPSVLKLAAMLPQFFKMVFNKEDNYRPIIILWNLSKVIEKIEKIILLDGYRHG